MGEYWKMAASIPSKPQPQSKKWYVIGVIAIVLILILVAASSVFPPQTSTPTPAKPKIAQLIFRIVCLSPWSGARTGNDGSSIVSWSGDGTGNGTLSVTINRPSDATSFWTVAANAQKQDNWPFTLTLSILFTNGTVARQASTSDAYGAVQVSYAVQD